MRTTVRTSGYMLFFLALAALSWDVMPMLQGGAFKLTSWGDMWYAVHPDSLHTYRVVVEQSISEELWDQLLAPLLVHKAVFVFAAPAIAFTALPYAMAIFNLAIEGILNS